MDEFKSKNIIKLSNSNNIINNYYKEKKSKIQTLANIIQELSINPNELTLNKIKLVNKKYEKEIKDIDNLIKIIDVNENNSDTKKIKKQRHKYTSSKKSLNTNDYIEFYSN